jgi:hypothetical protein
MTPSYPVSYDRTGLIGDVSLPLDRHVLVTPGVIRELGVLAFVDRPNRLLQGTAGDQALARRFHSGRPGGVGFGDGGPLFLGTAVFGYGTPAVRSDVVDHMVLLGAAPPGVD